MHNPAIICELKTLKNIAKIILSSSVFRTKLGIMGF